METKQLQTDWRVMMVACGKVVTAKVEKNMVTSKNALTWKHGIY